MWYTIRMLTQKLYKNGNSVAVTIPKQYLRELNLRDGSDVIVDVKGKALVVIPKTKIIAGGVDSQFAHMVDEFMNEHEDVLQELARK